MKKPSQKQGLWNRGTCRDVAEKEGFEPSRRLPQPTPLAGEPLQPYLGTSPTEFDSLFTCVSVRVPLSAANMAERVG